MEALAFLGVLLLLGIAVSPFVALVTSFSNKRRLADLERRVISQEAEIAWLRTQLQNAAERFKLLRVRVDALQEGAPPQVAQLPQVVYPVEAPTLQEVGIGSTVPPQPPEEPPQEVPFDPGGPQIPPGPVVDPVPPAGPAPAADPLPGPAPFTQQPPLEMPPPEMPPPETPPPVLKPPIDLEALLGVRGAAWLGAIALVIAGSLFAKYSIENNLIPPVVRVAFLILIGLGATVGGEVILRRGYATTANALAGAGIALLYAGLYAGHALYKLIPLPVTFAFMILTTVVAALLAIRHDAMFIAILGLLGGFATPIVLSTGQDHPVGLFTYVLLLDVGLLFVAVHKGWNTLTRLSLAATLLLQVGWFSSRMAPEKLLIVAIAFTGFGLLYLVLPLVAKKEDDKQLLQTSTLGGLSPYLFVLFLANSPTYAGQWPILFGFNACLTAALVAIALFRGRVHLAVAAGIATGLLLILWSQEQLAQDNLIPATLAALGLCGLLGIAPSLKNLAPFAAHFPADQRFRSVLLEAAALLPLGGLWFYGDTLIRRGFAEPPWGFLLLLLGLCLLGMVRSTKIVPPSIGAVIPFFAALLTQHWFMATSGAGPDHVLRNLSVPLLVAVFYMVIAAIRPSVEREIGGLLATVLAGIGLFWCLSNRSYGADPKPLLLAHGVLLVLLVNTVIRQKWGNLLLLSLANSALFFGAWHERYFHREDGYLMFPVYLTLYLIYFFGPFVLPLHKQVWPYVVSGLSGPVFFLHLYAAYVALFGKALIGILPLSMAAVSVSGLALVRHRFPGPLPLGPVGEGADPELKLRLRNLALFAAVVLGFISLAIPLQLNKQWITLGWALEAMAVFFLYQRLAHRGLKYFGAALYFLVGVRLLLNDSVLRYEERGLPVLNWILYTYGVAAAACFLGGWALGKVEEERLLEGEKRLFFGNKLVFAKAVSGLGLILVFALINLEIADYYSPSRYLELRWERQQDRDLTMSLAWGLYALLLLLIGMWRKARSLRFVSLGFMLLTILKVFLSDLAKLQGLGRILSFLGLAASLIVISLLYQRFVFRKESER